MKPWMLIALVLAIPSAGCLAEPPASPSSISTTPTEAANETLAAWPLIEFGLLGNATTQNDTVDYFVATDGTVAVTIRIGGDVVVSESVETGNRTWGLPVPLGRRDLNVTIEAAGLKQTDNHTITRLGETTLKLDYCYYHPSSQTSRKVMTYPVWIDVDSRPSAPLYEDAGATHTDAFTAHDQIYLFEQLFRVPVEVQYFASLQGFSVNKIDGVGNPVSSSAPPYWLYAVNGTDAETGMSLKKIQPGDVVEWRLTCAG